MKLKKLLIFSALSVFVLSNKAFSQNPFAKKGNYKSTEAYGMSGMAQALYLDILFLDFTEKQ
ncbi:MAG: hypothetical protein DCC88_10435 [Spirobacillus cienkowskii]|jgi:hypothetical protein|uniref:Uncharacterized protein n=1 Tax=Spirobacillus cienkowskii TaxID=495820 RepID=A0A369KNC9_9BACT|nr:MAG: hypothetical protein DCC88_10435 [Spirobacillus cienkowskii]